MHVLTLDKVDAYKRWCSTYCRMVYLKADYSLYEKT